MIMSRLLDDSGVTRVPALARLGPGDVAIALGAMLAAGAVYLYTVAPTVTGEDSGELIAAAYTLGIPHPSGFPLWCLLGKFFIELLPWGTVAWRVNVMSATFGAVTVGLICLLGIKLLGKRLPAVCGALAFAFSHEFWEQSLIAEVYTLNAFFIAVCLLLLITWYERRRSVWLYALALVYGLSLTNHGTMIMLGPLFLVFILAAERPRMRHIHRYSFGAVLIACGLLVFLYLPLRSRANPAIDWGNPEMWPAFWAHVTRAQYEFLFYQEPRSFAKLLDQIVLFGSMLVNEFSPWIVWLALPGAVVAMVRSHWSALLLLAVFFGVAFAFMIVPNYPIDQENNWVINVFWIPCYMVAGLLIGAGVGALAPRFQSPWLRAILIAVVVGLPFATHITTNNRRDYYLAEDFARNILQTMAPDAIYFAGSDHANFPVLYLQAVERERPDVLLANPYGYPRPSVYQDMPGEQRAQIAQPTPNSDDVARIERWVVQHTERPVYFSTYREFPTLPDKTVEPTGLLFRVVSSRENDLDDPFGTYTWRSTDRETVRDDFSGLWMLYDIHTAKGRAALRHGAFDQALHEYDTALANLPDSKQAYNNAGTDMLNAGLFEYAIEFYRRALELDPDFSTALRNLALVYGYTNQHTQALELYRQLSKVYPGDAQVLHGLGLSLLEQGMVDEGLQRLATAVELQPDNPLLQEDLGTSIWEHRHDAHAAIPALERAATLAPGNRRAANLLDRIRAAQSPTP